MSLKGAEEDQSCKLYGLTLKGKSLETSRMKLEYPAFI